MIKDQVVFSVL